MTKPSNSGPDFAGGAIRPSRLWLALFLVAAATISALKLTGAISSNLGFVLFAASMVLLWPMVNSMAREKSACAGAASLAYGRRMALFGAIYVVDLGIAIAVDRQVDVHGAASVLFALLPTLPILGMIWAMGRYLVEESDEFLRYRAAMAALIGLGVLLALATFVGFLERFGLNIDVEGWFALPVWALGMAAGRAWLARGDRVEDGE